MDFTFGGIMQKGYRIVDLSLPIINGGGFGMPARLRYLDHATRGKALADRSGFDPADIDHRANAMEEFSFLHTHTGTHFDAPYHTTDTVQGEPALTIDRVPLDWCFGPGVWLDLTHKAPGDDITAEDIEKALHKIGYTVHPGDIVLIKTGAAACYGQTACDNINSGMTAEATLWLAKRGVKLVGIDACCWDRPPQLQIESIKKGERKGRYMEGHRAAAEQGMCILEWLTNLDELPHHGFTIYAFPVKVEKAGGSWVRVVAMVED
jgi:kynurenine formamidase